MWWRRCEQKLRNRDCISVREAEIGHLGVWIVEFGLLQVIAKPGEEAPIAWSSEHCRAGGSVLGEYRRRQRVYCVNASPIFLRFKAGSKPGHQAVVVEHRADGTTLTVQGVAAEATGALHEGKRLVVAEQRIGIRGIGRVLGH